MSISPTTAAALMQRALDLAAKGIGRVEPNPAVGAVVVDSAGQIVGEGWHEQYGGPHAEVHALRAAGDAAQGGMLFVTLEPCCHFGKTPPCTKAVIAAGIRRVIVAIPDPAAHANGQGIEELRRAGIDVEVGLLSDQAKRLIAPFVRLQASKRPWFHAKWAMTLDGKIASRTGHSQWISNEASREVVHRLRGRMDAILVGIGTVVADDPMLTARPAGPRVATRVVLDSIAKLALNTRLVQTVSQAPVVVVTTANAPAERRKALGDAGVELLVVEADATGRPALAALAQELGRRRWTNVLVEGGAQVLGSFFDAGLIDEAHVFIASKLVGGTTAISPVGGIGLDRIPETASLDQPAIELLDGNVYVHGPLSGH